MKTYFYNKLQSLFRLLVATRNPDTKRAIRFRIQAVVKQASERGFELADLIEEIEIRDIAA